MWEPLGESSNGRTSGFGPENRGSNPCSPVARAMTSAVRLLPVRVVRTTVSGVTLAPTVLILAAGQGTRMRSKTPKVLHELCGRPMLLWPVHAALEAGAEKVVVVDSPARALEGVLPEGVELAVQPQSNGTGGAVVAAMSQLKSQARNIGAEHTGGGPERRRAAGERRGDPRADRGPRAERRGGDDGDDGARRSGRLRTGGAWRGRRGGARGGDQEGGRREPGGARDQRGEHGDLRLRRGRADRRVAAIERRERPGRAVSAAGAGHPQGRRAGGGGPHGRGPEPGARGQRPRGAWRRSASWLSGRSTSGTCAPGWTSSTRRRR